MIAVFLIAFAALACFVGLLCVLGSQECRARDRRALEQQAAREAQSRTPGGLVAG